MLILEFSEKFYEFTYRNVSRLWPRKSAQRYRLKSQFCDDVHRVQVEIEADIFGWTVHDATASQTKPIVLHESADRYDRIGTAANYSGSSQLKRNYGHGVFMIITQIDKTRKPDRLPFWQSEDWFYMQFEDPE